MKRTWKTVGLGTLAALIVIQFVRPGRTNPPFDSALSLDSSGTVPPAVLAKLRASCYDCHSNETRWPWYSAITPVNFLIASDVNGGRRHMNFSEWRLMKPERMQSRLGNISDEVSSREMPLPIYLLMHRDAHLSDADVKLISDWADARQDSMAVLTGAGGN